MSHRLQDNSKNKRYFWSLLITISMWLTVAVVVLATNPEDVADLFLTGGYLLLTLPLSIACWFSFSLVLGNSRIGAIATLGVIVSVYLRIFSVGAWWVLVPWWGLIGCTIIFLLSYKKEKEVDKGEAN